MTAARSVCTSCSSEQLAGSLSERRRISIPARKLGDVGLRAIIGPHDAVRVFKILRRRPRRMTGPWPQLSREIYKKLNSGSLFDAAELVRDLSKWKRRRPLSATVQHLLDVARDLVGAELAAATGRTEHEVALEIRELLDT